MKYICSICGYVYDEAGNTPWAELPDDSAEEPEADPKE